MIAGYIVFCCCTATIVVLLLDTSVEALTLNIPYTRRCLLRGIVTLPVVVLVEKVNAAEGNLSVPIKPYAPLEALLPATRAKRIIDDSLTAATVIKGSLSESARSDQIYRLSTLLFESTTVGGSSTRKAANEMTQLSKAQKDSYNQELRNLPFWQKPGAILIQGGEKTTWQTLRKRERARESDDEFRAAFNLYIDNLNFNPDRYLLTATPELRKQLIREDRLPDIMSVIAADLDLRVLYRNEVLNAMDDARAEWIYQLSQPEYDMTDLIDLLSLAQKGCTMWFSFIDESDVRDALLAIQGEESLL